MKNFFWGVATSSYQIEGAADKDGRAHSIWDTFCEQYPERIEGRANGKQACNHYYQYKEDIAIMQELGIGAYRFSISWSRILPQGTGEINMAGITFYRNLIDELLQKGITPFLTLYHWDLPQALQDQGGWLNSNSPEWFASYATTIATYFGDTVKYMITFNEPQVFMGEFVSGKGAPGKKANRKEVLQMAHHVLLAQGRAVQEIRKVHKDIKIGYAPTFTFYYPVTEGDIEEARRLNFSIQDTDDYLWNVTWWSDPVLLGHYPAEGLAIFKEDMPVVTEEEMKIIAEPIDFYGQNIYQGSPVGGKRKNNKKTEMKWSIDPEVLYWAPKFLYERYHIPIILTENGIASKDTITKEGRIEDTKRISFLESYITQLLKAKEEGIPIDGYFVWSLLDNFEWLNGYEKRFGLVYVDYASQKRIIKDSGYWYRDYIKQQKKGNP